MIEIKEKNAVITAAYFDTERGLSAWLTLDYGGSGQGFGGYLLYAPKGWNSHGGANYCGHFVYRCLEIADSSDWTKLVGRTIRVRADHGKVHAIGHIVKDDWFYPSDDFSKMQEQE